MSNDKAYSTNIFRNICIQNLDLFLLVPVLKKSEINNLFAYVVVHYYFKISLFYDLYQAERSLNIRYDHFYFSRVFWESAQVFCMESKQY